MRKINIAVIDSNYKDRMHTISLVEEFFNGARMKPNVEWFNSGYGLLGDIHERGSYDIYLIEPILPDVNGIRLVKELRKKSEHGKVIFLSRSESYAFAAFEVRAYDYILKTANKDRLFRTLDNAIQDIIKNMAIPVVELELQTGYIRVPVDNIYYIDIVNRALCYHMEDGTEYSSKCLRRGFTEAVEIFLEQPWFIKAGATRILNASCIRMLYKSSAVMNNGETVPITQASYQAVKRIWSETKL